MSWHTPYRHTIDWAFTKVPDDVTGPARFDWVANYLADVRHWQALEEFLQRLHTQKRIASGDPC